MLAATIIFISVKYDFLILHISMKGILIIFLYLLSMRMIYSVESREFGSQLRYSSASAVERKTGRLGFRILAGVAGVAFSGVVASNACDQISIHTGLGSTFVGTLFLAFATSLPEIAVSISAARLGSIDMAVGNVFGSNLFNVVILSISDIFYLHGSAFAEVSGLQILTAGGCVLLSTLVISARIVEGVKRLRFIRFGVDSVIIFFIYLVIMLTLFSMSAG
jgi:cation:H+ antiporter